MKNAKDLDFKMRNFLHHLEYEESGLNINELEKLIKNKEIMYDHKADKKDQNKWKSSKKLEKVELSSLPEYVKENSTKFNQWLD